MSSPLPSTATPPAQRRFSVLQGRPLFRGRQSLTAIGRSRFEERHRILVRNPLPLGTNGYSTSWGTNAHGELSACPPGRR
ncbi:hypothetical protein [Nocardiopsis sp. ATB16-24]|uniref:hypothetical protein n=1 Tax=Nocardiopsis sp. ATB16-24 TaxID=3019555 RepID=UPI00255694C9|nr:hypothetical protein [Nocardiopsis sp. ATB16-24]